MLVNYHMITVSDSVFKDDFEGDHNVPPSNVGGSGCGHTFA